MHVLNVKSASLNYCIRTIFSYCMHRLLLCTAVHLMHKHYLRVSSCALLKYPSAVVNGSYMHTTFDEVLMYLH
jgi:hypothetical protein